MTHPTDADVEAMALLPCPFCGGAARLHVTPPPYPSSLVECLTKDCHGAGHLYKCDALAIAAWNRRTISAHYLRAVETLERLRSASKHGESRGRSSGSDPVRVAEEASLPDADLIRAVEEREGLIEALEGMVQWGHRPFGKFSEAKWDNALANARAILSRAQASTPEASPAAEEGEGR